MDEFARSSLEGYRGDMYETCVERAEGGGFEHDVGEAFEVFCDRLESRSDSQPRVLDVGCGPGQGAIPMTENGYRVLGIDLVEEFLHVARERTRGRANLARMDMRTLCVRDAVFDGRWASASFYHLPRCDAAQTATEFHRVLTPGAVLFCCVARGEGTDTVAGGPRITLWEPNEFRELFGEAGFTVDRFDTPGEWLFLHGTA